MFKEQTEEYIHSAIEHLSEIEVDASDRLFKVQRTTHMIYCVIAYYLDDDNASGKVMDLAGHALNLHDSLATNEAQQSLMKARKIVEELFHPVVVTCANRRAMSFIYATNEAHEKKVLKHYGAPNPFFVNIDEGDRMRLKKDVPLSGNDPVFIGETGEIVEIADKFVAFRPDSADVRRWTELGTIDFHLDDNAYQAKYPKTAQSFEQYVLDYLEPIDK